MSLNLLNLMTGPAGLLTIRHAHSPICCVHGALTATALRNGITDTVLPKLLRKPIRMNGNVTLETRSQYGSRDWVFLLCATASGFIDGCAKAAGLHEPCVS